MGRRSSHNALSWLVFILACAGCQELLGIEPGELRPAAGGAGGASTGEGAGGLGFGGSGGGSEGCLPDGLLSHYVAADLTATIDDGEQVATWEDPASGSLTNEATTGPRLRHRGINGRPALEFDGVTHELSRTYDPGTFLDDPLLTIFVVGRDNERSPSSAVRTAWSLEDQPSLELILLSSGPFGLRFMHDTTSTEMSVSIPHDGNFNVWTASRSSTEMTLRSNTESDGVLALAGSFSEVQLRVGVGVPAANDFWHGYIAEIVIYDTPLTETQINATVACLSAAYGI